MTALKSTPLYMFSGFRSAYERMVSFAQQARPGFVCFCVGPGGAGKSRLSKMIGPEAFGARALWPKGAQPFVWVSADNSDKAYFNPKSFTKQCLLELGDPFVTRPLDVVGADMDAAAARAIAQQSLANSKLNRSEMDLRDTFVRLASLRQVKLLIVDEANLLVMAQANRRPTDYLESLRLLGDRIGCSILLLGTIDLLHLTDYSAQLNRRSVFVHLGRMGCETRDAKAEFVEFLKDIERDNGMTVGVLSEHPGDIYEWTYGIPGEIDGLVTRAVIHAANDVSKVDWTHVAASRPLPRIMKRMRAEADLIEASMELEPQVPPSRSTAIPSKRPFVKPRMTPRRRPAGVVR